MVAMISYMAGKAQSQYGGTRSAGKTKCIANAKPPRFSKNADSGALRESWPTRTNRRSSVAVGILLGLARKLKKISKPLYARSVHRRIK